MAAATKRTYKLQEFVAHATDVNCIKIGRRTSRILITGGEDQKVNLWAIGKPSAILSLSGLTSPVESVSFDSSEVMVAAGAASGTIKIWDVEEAKVVRTFTGHRSNCKSLDFHPFGEFFASGSSDTNMKIWDIRKKGCIHTYKGHTRRIDVLRFTPDGRWIVSGGADSSVKVWDLTAGKLLNDFRLHEGPINCIDFHPHEFLLATGSADKTVKFWDLETFELIGFSEPENSREYFVPASVVRSMTFNSDGKTLFCGLHESLKVLTWEPIVCHDVVDVGWSTLVDLNVHEGKLLGCSYNQSCVGIWVVDLTKIEPYAVNNAQANSNESTSHPRQADSSISSVLGRLSVSRSPARQISSNTMHRRSISASKELSFPDSPIVTKRLQTTDLWHATAPVSPRVRLNPDVNTEQRTQTAVVAPLAASKTTSQVDLSTSPGTVYCNSLGSAGHTYRSRYSLSADNSKESSFVPVVIPRNSSKMSDRSNLSKGASVEPPVINPRNTFKGNPATGHGKEDDKVVTAIASRSSRVDLEAGPTRDASDVVCIMPKSSNLRVKLDSDSGRSAPESEKVLYTLQPKPISSQRKCTRDALGGEDMNYSGSVCSESVESNEVGDWYNISGFEKPKPAVGKNPELVKINRSAMSGLSQLMKSTERNTVEYRPTSVNYERSLYPPTLDGLGRLSLNDEEQTTSAGDDDVMADLMENHQEFLTVSQSRLTKLQVVYRYWQINDIKGALDAMKRISDLAVIADAVSVLMDNRNRLTLYLCTSLLPLISNLLESRLDRHLKIALESILTLVKSFGGIISSTLSAAPLVGVDLEAERRFERCSLCFLELEKIKSIALSMTRQRGEIGRLAQELSLLLQEIVQASSR